MMLKATGDLTGKTFGATQTKVFISGIAGYL
jgi:hypothetical protein